MQPASSRYVWLCEVMLRFAEYGEVLYREVSRCHAMFCQVAHCKVKFN
jgi:hypothetical protein